MQMPNIYVIRNSDCHAMSAMKSVQHTIRTLFTWSFLFENLYNLCRGLGFGVIRNNSVNGSKYVPMKIYNSVLDNKNSYYQKTPQKAYYIVPNLTCHINYYISLNRFACIENNWVWKLHNQSIF